MAKILDGRKVADTLSLQLADQLAQIDSQLTLGILQVGDSSASSAYIKRKIAAAKKLGVKVQWQKLSEYATAAELISQMLSWNDDKQITGYIVQLPLPQHMETIDIMSHIDPIKDVDGLGSYNLGLLSQSQPKIIPATTRGIYSLLKHYQIDPAGQHVVVVGRSNLVGKPTASLMLNQHATVTITHSQTRDITAYTQQADILIVAAGQPEFITEDHIKPEVIIIDVGISRSQRGLVGDVDFQSVTSKASAITPVPGGVGPLTVISLFQNLLDLHKLQTKSADR